MTELTKLKEWKGNTDYNSGFIRAQKMFKASPYSSKYHSKYLNRQKNRGTHSSSFINGFTAGIKQCRLESLLTNG